MKKRTSRRDLTCALAWAIFTLGATHLGFVLGGPAILPLAMSCCAALFAIFLFKATALGVRTRKAIAGPYLYSTGILIAGNVIYLKLVFLKSDTLHILFFGANVIIYLIPLLIVMFFVPVQQHVTR